MSSYPPFQKHIFPRVSGSLGDQGIFRSIPQFIFQILSLWALRWLPWKGKCCWYESLPLGELKSLRPRPIEVTHRDDWCQERSSHTVPLGSKSPARAGSSLYRDHICPAMQGAGWWGPSLLSCSLKCQLRGFGFQKSLKCHICQSTATEEGQSPHRGRFSH